MTRHTSSVSAVTPIESPWSRFLHRGFRNHGVTLCALSVSFTLAGHAGSLFSVSPSERYVSFTASAFRDSEPTVVRAYLARYNEEYLLFEGQGAQAELVYVAMNNVGEPSFREVDALEFFSSDFLKRNETWKINRNRPREWDTKATYRTKIIDSSFYEAQMFTYAPYRLVDGGRSCFNFETKWDEPGYDPYFSPRQLLFGYYCDPPGRTLTKERIGELISSLHVRNDPLSLGMAGLPKGRAAVRDPELAARGKTHDTGNVEFPLLFHIIEGQIGQGDDGGSGMN